jgi:hypothetical protein
MPMFHHMYIWIFDQSHPLEGEKRSNLKTLGGNDLMFTSTFPVWPSWWPLVISSLGKAMADHI